MNTVIDVGNTRVKVGFFEDEKLSASGAFNWQPWQNFYAFFEGKKLGNCIISATIPLPSHIIQYIKSKTEKFILLDENTPLPLANIYKTKNTLGKDRIALAVGASHIYPSQKMLVVNAGTCVTYNFLNEAGEFVGGAISPGLQMRFRAMHHFTAQLPLADIGEEETSIIGTSTEESLRSGAINGLIFEMQGYINTLKQQHPGIKIILSGGDSRYLANQSILKKNNSIILQPDLALQGLNKILQFNVEK